MIADKKQSSQAASLKYVTKCVDIISELIKAGNNEIIKECIIVIMDMCRKYRNRYEHVISLLREHLDEFRNPEAKASFVYLLGEFADIIENAFELLLNRVTDEVSFLSEDKRCSYKY